MDGESGDDTGGVEIESRTSTGKFKDIIITRFGQS